VSASADSLPVVPHWIGGAEYVRAGGRTAPVFDPARGVVTKRVALANRTLVDAAVATATAAFPAWSGLSLARRQAVLFKSNGVFTVLNGDKEAVDGLLTHPDVRSVSFVGSTPVARYVHETGTAHGKRVQALGGAKNHMLVLPDADLDLTADSAVSAGFGSAGERCMAISVVVAVAPVADALIGKISERMATLKIGDGRRNCDMGPLVTREHRDKVASYIDVAKADGAVVVIDGRGVAVDGDPNGFWLGPTLLDDVPVTSRAYTEEIFGPVLSVVRVTSADEGIALINSGAFGNGTAIFTRDGGAARRFTRQVQVGMIGINVPIPVPVATFSFGGWKDSLFGDVKAHGAEGVRFFTQLKAITSRWPDPGQDQSGALSLGFPENE
jgi:malonate-semialdehyde dehydrogenase (acetylating)/methylmalonate-semialdehyde dehydrogenase